MKIGVIGDAHLGCANYSEKRRADFATAFRNAVEACLGQQAEVICLLGDVFDSDIMRRKVDAFADALVGIAPALTELRKAGIPLLAIAGNHEYGRGRRAGELRSLEALGLVRLLSSEEVVVGGVGVVGIPWQQTESVHEVGSIASRLAGASNAKRRVLLLHNYVRGSTRIPSHLWEIDPNVAKGFDRVFVGHHHDYEELGPFLIPGSTEVRDVSEAENQKGVIVYDADSGRHSFHKLPPTHRVVALTYDAGACRREELLAAISADLDRSGASTSAFVCIRIMGAVRAGGSVTRAEVAALLKGRTFFDHYIEIRLSTKTKQGTEVLQGASIDHLLRKNFPKQESKAREYLDTCTTSDFTTRLRDRIAS